MDVAEKLRNRIENSDVSILSFPKSGRTWIRFFLAKYEELEYGILFELEIRDNPGLPRILFSHNFFDFNQENDKEPKILLPDLLNNRKILLLVRDPRDVAVSYYHQKKDREKTFKGSIDEFIRSPVYGIERQSDFVLQLMDFYKKKTDEKIFVRFKDLKTDPAKYFTEIAGFIYSQVSHKNIKRAVNESSFSSMKKYELNLSKSADNIDEGARLGSNDWKNEDTLKIRKGKVHGYKEELDKKTLNYIKTLPKTQQLIKIINNI